jgi:TRAP transporter TAXI family solute receptor
VDDELFVLRLTTGTPGGGFHPFGQALADALEQVSPNMRLQVQTSGGSVANVRAIHDNRADIGLAFADVAYNAFSGQRESGAVPLTELRAIAVIQLTPVQLVARAGSAIRGMSDLRGQRIAVGPADGGTALTARLILQAFAVPLSSVTIDTRPFLEAGALLARGGLDAMFDNAVQPAESAALALRAGARLIPITGAPVDRLRRDYPFIRLTVVPGNMYPGSLATSTIGIDCLLVCRRTLPEDVVYELTRHLFEALALLSTRAVVDFAGLDQAPATPIPLHDGAARYYREQELLR